MGKYCLAKTVITRLAVQKKRQSILGSGLRATKI